MVGKSTSGYWYGSGEQLLWLIRLKFSVSLLCITAFNWNKSMAFIFQAPMFNQQPAQ